MGSFGSKATSGLYPLLPGLQPPHDLYVATHLGGGALRKRKAPTLRSIGIDRDRRALEGFGCDDPVERIHGCAHAFLASFAFRGPEQVYSNPPYLQATRRLGRRYRRNFTDAGPVELLELLKGLPCPVTRSRATPRRGTTA